MVEIHAHCSRGLLTRIAIVALLLFQFGQWNWASYKIHLKDGKVIEAKSKPISMEGQLRFTTLDGRFLALPVTSIDNIQTEKSNGSIRAKESATKVLTNDDLSQRNNEQHKPEDSVATGGPGKLSPKRSTSPREQRQDESYWRNRAKQIRDRIASVDSEIKQLDEKRDSGKSDGVRIGYGTTTQYVLANFEDQRKKLEKDRQDLENQMRALEEEARQAGAMPGWLR
jgi:hypothetical protein